MRHLTSWSALLVVAALMWPVEHASAQGVTTGLMTGVVTDSAKQPVSGAQVIAIHLPSGTSYEATTRDDGRYSMPNMRVGGPYSVTVAFVGGSGTAFQPETVENIEVNLGVATDLPISVKAIAVTETVTVTATSDTVFSSARTGAATSVSRESIATLPTISGRIQDLTRLTPQAAGMSFAGQDNRLNNITVDGSYFNNSFGLGGQPGDRTGVAPISLESIEQIQVSVAPFDVRQGNFVGANVNTITRSGTNRVTASLYHRFRNNNFVGTDAAGLPYDPGDFDTKQTGLWMGAPIVKNRLFVFGNYEDEKDTRPLNNFLANRGGQTVAGNTTRVLASELDTLSSYLRQNFQYETGPYEGIDDLTPQKRFLLRNDFNVNNSNKISFRYTQLESSTDVNLSGSTSAGFGRNTFRSDFLNFQASNYQILENIKSGVGEWNWIIGNSMSNQIQAGYTANDESRGDIGPLFPFVDIQDGNQVTYTSFGSEPFTPNNELRYNTFQFKDDFMKFGNRHTFTFGATVQRYESENVFFPLQQSAYVYNTLQDFFTDANGFLANPNRTVSPVTLRRFQVRYMNLPGLDKPLQPLEVWYSGGYAQDEWRPRSNMTITMGMRLDVSRFKDTAFPNAQIDALTFRDEAGQPVQYESGKLPDPKILWSPRFGLNWDVRSDQRTQLRGGTGVFTGPPLYVWISNQLGQTGVLTGLVDVQNTTAFPFHRDPNRYKPTNVTGTPATSTEFNVTDNTFKFPQIWRSNIALDQRLPGGITGTAEFIYNKDVNGIYYINANLPAAQSAFVGVDNRPRWTGPTCAAAGGVGPCVTRINQTPGNVITSAIVMKNQDVGSSWNLAFSARKPNFHGLTLNGAYSYGESKNTIDPGSTAFASWAGNPHVNDPNNPGLGFSSGSPGHRVFFQASYTRSYFDFGATTISMFWEARNGSNTSYVFAGDMNGDGASNNDLIYIPRDASEMNFVTFTCPVPTCATATTFTAQQQVEAFERYISQDNYLSKHRGEYARRGAVFLPFVKRADLSFVQEVFKNIKGRRNGGQFRIDIQNIGNLLNSEWGVGQRVIRNQILTNAAADAQGRASYRLAVVNNQLLTNTFETTTFIQDVYQFMLSFRYSFQ
jgi:hypothetical protein